MDNDTQCGAYERRRVDAGSVRCLYMRRVRPGAHHGDGRTTGGPI
jgi:hypothetical protein